MSPVSGIKPLPLTGGVGLNYLPRRHNASKVSKAAKK